MKKVLVSVLATLTALTLVACAAPPIVSADEVRSDMPRVAPAAPPTDVKTLVDGNTAFALELYKQIRQGSDNMFYSPYSISAALAMTWVGARGDTETQMAQALNFNLSQDRLHAAFNALDQKLQERGEGAAGKDGEAFRLNIVNAIWGQRDYTFLPAFLDVLAQNYAAGLRVLDFQAAPEPSRVAINDWVSDQTNARIQDLLPEGSVTDLTRLVLTNAVYFNAAWLKPFGEEATAPDAFHLVDGSEVTVPMMRQSQPFAYARGDNYQAIELLYDGREMSMVILLPDSGRFQVFEDALDARLLETALGNLETTQVDLVMPTFRMEAEFGLKDALTALGMSDAFNPGRADLSGMNGNRELYISDVVHKAFVEVDEAGTEAAAATGVIVGIVSAPTDSVQLTIDRPFIFLIRDIESGAVVFLGRVMNPA